MMQSLSSYAECPALPLSDCLMAVGGEAFDWLSNRAGRGHKAVAQRQPFGPELFAHKAASSLSCVSTYTPSFFLALRANSSRRGVLGI
jgi:hypothetical protein